MEYVHFVLIFIAQSELYIYNPRSVSDQCVYLRRLLHLLQAVLKPSISSHGSATLSLIIYLKIWIVTQPHHNGSHLEFIVSSSNRSYLIYKVIPSDHKGILL
jgi:hypothetical protein